MYIQTQNLLDIYIRIGDEKMIFITVGSQKFQFNRLLKEIDNLIDKKDITEIVFAQIGDSDYIPRNYEYKRYLNQDEFKEKMNMADLIITHGGTGAIITGLKNKKKIIAIPRLAKYAEHVDNHQTQIVNAFVQANLIFGVNEISELKEKIIEIKTHQFSSFQTNNKVFLKNIENDILDMKGN